MATNVAHYEDNFSLGGLLGEAFSTITENPLVTLGTAFLFGALPSALLEWLNPLKVAGPMTSGGIGIPLAFVLVGIVALVFCASVMQGAMTQAALAHREGRKAGLGEVIATGLRCSGPLFLLGIVMSIGISIGFLLLIVPGIILSLMWMVAAPALVIERRGIFATLSRSRELTKGARWKILALILVGFVAIIIVSALFGIFAGLLMAVTGTVSKLAVIPTMIGQTLGSAFMVVVIASLFLELRSSKEGPATDALSDIFA